MTRNHEKSPTFYKFKNQLEFRALYSSEKKVEKKIHNFAVS